MSKVFIIAEAGVNHNGSVQLAKKLIDVAVEAGVDAIKFQTWKTELIVTKSAKQAVYQEENTGVIESQFEMLKKLELSYDNFRELKLYCDNKNIFFMSTPDEIESVNFLCGLQNIFKIGSGELTNLPYLRHLGQLGKELIISTGMANMKEVENALAVLIEAGTPKEKITILHATTDYPCSYGEVNLRAMQTIQSVLGVKVGYSDHTRGIEVPIAAVSMGATIIEKHFTLDCKMEGLEPDELKAMVIAIRNVEHALGDGIKKPTQNEEKNIQIVRKSIVAACSIGIGEPFDSSNLAIKRPGNGISPMKWDELIGQISQKNYERDDLI